MNTPQEVFGDDERCKGCGLHIEKAWLRRIRTQHLGHRDLGNEDEKASCRRKTHVAVRDTASELGLPILIALSSVADGQPETRDLNELSDRRHTYRKPIASNYLRVAATSVLLVSNALL